MMAFTMIEVPQPEAIAKGRGFGSQSSPGEHPLALGHALAQRVGTQCQGCEPPALAARPFTCLSPRARGALLH